ncbi:MAG: glycosyltransferase family 39 protein [Anaerolineae bacterium]
MSARAWPHWAILLILAGYLAVAACYAIWTPAWQVPDEPAHYNYARYLAENRRFPVLQAGDYPHSYLEEIKARRFPPDMSVDPIRYESHQPPLYYILAAGVYALFAGAPLPVRLTAMRLLSVLIGAGTILLAYMLVRENFPGRPSLAWGTAAFIAFLPMHIAITAGVNNDALAELMLAVILLWLLRYLRRRPGRQSPMPFRDWLFLGLLLGLGLLTKTSVYIALPITALVILWGEGRRALRGWLVSFGTALLMALPWYVRNALTYGGLDILGLGRHDAVTQEQLRTAAWLASHDLHSLLTRFVETTFQSFWGQFGWMGVLLDSRLYALLALLSGLAAFGVFWWLMRLLRRQTRLFPRETRALAVLGWSAFLTVLGYLWYNVQFIQHQGRYLFPALIPIGLAFAVGLYQLTTPAGARAAALFCSALTVALLVWGAVTDDPPLLWIALTAGAAVGFTVQGRLGSPRSQQAILWAFFAGMWMLDWVCLFGFIVPALAG